MEEKASVTLAMVSRLPKFGGRFSSCGPNVVCNGSTQPSTPSQDVKATPGGSQPSGGIRSSGFSLKWKRGQGGVSNTTNTTEPPDREAEKVQTQLPSLAKQFKSGSPGTPKIPRSGLSVATVANAKAADKRPSKTQSPKAETKLSHSTFKGGSKMVPNSSFTSARTGSESRLSRPKLGSSASRSSSQDSLSQFSDPSLALDNIVRSHSFSHIKQVPSPTNQTMTRSFSFNRAVELAKPLANTQLRPPRSSFLKPPQLSNGRVGPRLGGLNGNLESLEDLQGNNNSRSSSAALSQNSSVATAAPPCPSALKKPLFPGCLLTKAVNTTGGSLGFKLTRPVQSRQQKLLFPGQVTGAVRPPTAPQPLNLQPPGESEKNNLQSESEGSSPLRQTGSETLEDMSISSASSVDRGEEFMDDLDSVGDVLSDGDMPDNRTDVHSTQTHHNIDIEGCGEESPMQDSQGPLVSSSDLSENPEASSLELSPSNSSGGTYMWDEEGLEPLGGTGTHQLDSYDDSELNSLNVVNNLDARGAGELEEDDLMLDVDLLEDDFYDLNRMSFGERSEKSGRPGPRRKHQRWSGSDRFHNDRAQLFQQYDGLKPSRSRTTEGRQLGPGAVSDQLALEDMTQDCNSLKIQLLRLKTLLQLDESNSKDLNCEETEEKKTASQMEELMKEMQMEELMKEMQVLKEELRGRDETIARLTLQCQQLQQQQSTAPGHHVKVQCHQQRAPSLIRPGERRMQRHYDKATQTYWRPHSHAGVLPTPLLSPWQAQHQSFSRPSMHQRRQTSNTTVFQSLHQRAAPPVGKNSKNSHRGPQ